MTLHLNFTFLEMKRMILLFFPFGRNTIYLNGRSGPWHMTNFIGAPLVFQLTMSREQILSFFMTANNVFFYLRQRIEHNGIAILHVWNQNKFEYRCSYNVTSLELVQECVNAAIYKLQCKNVCVRSARTFAHLILKLNMNMNITSFVGIQI